MYGILIIGPTGSGKTPLGDELKKNGLWKKPCLHFDFGAQLRDLATNSRPHNGFSESEIEFIQKILFEGALLENSHFPLVKKIWTWFIGRHNAEPDAIVILNGLPRHVDQAKGMEPLIRINGLVCLNATPDVLLERIRENCGKDRTGRTDDETGMIQKKLIIYRNRTEPLISYLRQAGAKMIEYKVTPRTTAHEIHAAMEGMNDFLQPNN